MDANTLAPLSVASIQQRINATSTKQRIAIVCCILAVCALMIGGTIAYFFDQETVTNVFTSSDGVDIELTESEWVADSAENLLPGDSLDKNPTVTSNTDTEIYMRIVVELQDEEGETITDSEVAEMILDMIVYSDPALSTGEGYSYSLADLSSYPTVNSDLNSGFTLDTTRGGTGVYYYNYNSTMNNGDSVTLFTNVAVPTDWDNDDIEKVGDFSIVIRAEAIQASGFSSAADAFDALDVELAGYVAP